MGRNNCVIITERLRRGRGNGVQKDSCHGVHMNEERDKKHASGTAHQTQRDRAAAAAFVGGSLNVSGKTQQEAGRWERDPLTLSNKARA